MTLTLLQDQYGDTPLHDAIDKDNTEAIDMLLRVKSIDLQAKNKKGFNLLQHACLKGNAQCVAVVDVVGWLWLVVVTVSKSG